MISIHNSADLARALADPLDPALRRLLELRRDQLTAGTDADLGDLVHIVVAQPVDTLAALEAEAGVPLGADNHFEWTERHGWWLEAVTVLNDDGYAVALFVPDRIGIDPALLLPLLASA